jgi:hypothetical protein
MGIRRLWYNVQKSVVLVMVTIGSRVDLLPIPLRTTIFLVNHIHAFIIHVTISILFKGVLLSRSSCLLTNKENLGFIFPCHGLGKGETCQVYAWDYVFLGFF